MTVMATEYDGTWQRAKTWDLVVVSLAGGPCLGLVVGKEQELVDRSFATTYHVKLWHSDIKGWSTRIRCEENEIESICALSWVEALVCL